MGPPLSNPATPPWITGCATTEAIIAYAEGAVGDRYRIESLAGRGGMGRVFSARDTELGSPVAIKLLILPPPDRADEPLASRASRAGERLTAEARALASLEHPNLCRIVEVALDAPIPYIVMQWAGGEPLDRVAAHLTVKARITLLLRVIDAVAAIHESGLTHGDLKPDNILVDPSNTPTIVDFGLARAESDSSPPRAGGSPGYAAPEQLLSGAPLTNEADVFALGVLLYELLTGEPPIPRNTAPMIAAAMLERGAIRLPQEIAADTPADLQKICLAALEHDPARRYPDAGALAADIRRYLRKETVAARPTLLTARLNDDVESQIERTREWRRLGMISKRDADNAARVLRALPHAESPWTIDARRLRGSQAALVAGGFLLVLAIAAGVTQSKLHPVPASLLVWIPACAVLLLGLRLHRSGHKRLGLGMLATAQFAVPAASWVTLRATGWLTNLTPGPPATTSRIANLYAGEPTIIPGVIDTHAIAASGIAALTAALLAVLTRRPLFKLALTTSLILNVALSILLTRAFAGAGLDGLRETLHSWTFIVALPLAAVAVYLQTQHDAHRAETDTAYRTGVGIGILAFTTLLVGVLSLLAAVNPGLSLGRPAVPTTPALTAYAFFVNAGLVGLVLLPSFRRPTPVNRRVAAVARWVLPTHLMLPLIFMDIHETFSVRTPWLIALGLASVAFTAASALHQWRPFLLAGLVFLPIWFVRTLDALPPAGDLILTLTTLTLGLALMLAAWRAPAYLAKRRLARWTRAADARPDPRSRRTWR